MPVNYDKAAWFYDGLAKVVFGSALQQAQDLYLPLVKAGDKILIVGGGTGLIIEWISKLNPNGLCITYVESSLAMINKAKKRYIAQNEVLYLNCPIEEFDSKTIYNVVITSFLFDNFLNKEAEYIFKHINNYLKPEGIWLYTDFRHPEKIWQIGMLKIMLLFFKFFCKVEVSKLPDIENLFRKNDYELTEQENFYKGFITARVYTSPQNKETF